MKVALSRQLLGPAAGGSAEEPGFRGSERVYSVVLFGIERWSCRHKSWLEGSRTGAGCCSGSGPEALGSRVRLGEGVRAAAVLAGRDCGRAQAAAWSGLGFGAGFLVGIDGGFSRILRVGGRPLPARPRRGRPPGGSGARPFPAENGNLRGAARCSVSLLEGQFY